MSALDPSAPSQPTQQTGLDQSQNPASKTAQEQNDSKVPSSGAPIDHREQHDVPSQHGEAATASSLGYGDTGPLKEKKLPGLKGQHDDLEGEQMRAAGEGDVAEAVRSGGGGGHASEPSLTENMDDKAKEHADELHARGQKTGREMEESKGEEEDEDWTGKGKDVDVGSALGGRGTKVVLAADE